ncbi:MAG: O-antigen ligase family protein [Candidatus Daviesbacteria bacterium]|nr:O-antigen ligase family protein [Candidatus Daviesbacteria bacterium]
MLERIIPYCFYVLFFLTPLFWTSKNYELFEFNKMLLVYSFTVIIVGVWILKMIQQKSFIFKRTPLDLPLLLFLLANILATIFSIDKHVSIWGYYSRLNGGLISIISYLLLYWAYCSNFDGKNIKKLFYFAFASGTIISLWGILEHFGVSPSCIILRGELNASCWVQDVQARVFATLGQPNWMAGYLAMLIFPALYFLLTAKTKVQQVSSYLLLVTFYLAFTFTYSRGPTLGLIGGFIVFILLSSPRRRGSNSESSYFNWIPAFAGMTKGIIVILLSFLAINLLFGSALTNFKLVSQFAAPTRPTISLPPSSVTQLEQGGTESGQIRFIVWRGALDIFRHYPIFGSGLETFAYAYYQFRPVEHNLTSEWDFLYNKAHNEYLNYLATTGLIGFLTYMGVIGTFVIWCVKGIMNKELRIKLNSSFLILTALFASYISYLIYNFFLFSVVIIALFFYIFPAIAFVATDSTKQLKFPKKLFTSFIYRRPAYTKATQVIIVVSIFYLLFSIFQLWYTDTLFAQGQRASDAGNPGRAYNLLTTAHEIRGDEPFYQSELSLAAASAAVALAEIGDASSSATLKNEAISTIEHVLKNNPNNVSYMRAGIRTYFELSSIDESFIDDTLTVIDQAIQLAPTDPKLYYNKALILQLNGKDAEAIETLQKAIELKPNYVQAIDQLNEATASARP